MKKLILLFLLLPFLSMAQVSTGQEQEFDTGIKNNSTQTVTSPTYIVTQGNDGTYGKVTPANLLTQTTAGTFARVNFTGDISVVNAVNYYATSTTSKGSTASVAQTVAPDDNQKLYFAQDYISILQPSLVIYPAGNYSGQFAVQVAANSVQQKFYIEVYKTNNLGVPIASGVSGATVGSLGVTLITTLESGLVSLTGSTLTNITLTGNLTGVLTVNANERIRYHIAAEKVGTAGGTISMQIFSGTSYNSYYDVPVPVTTDGVVNKAPGLGNTSTDALVFLNTNKANDSNVLHTTGNETKTSGTLTLNDQLKLANGTPSAPSILFPDEDASDTGINHVNNGEIQFITNGSNLTQIKGTGVTSVAFIKTGATAGNALLAGGGDLANPISGTGTSGRVAFFNGITTQTGSPEFFWDNGAKRLGLSASGMFTPSALLHLLRAGSPISAVGDELIIAQRGTNSAENAAITIVSEGESVLRMTKPGSTELGAIKYNNVTNEISFTTNSTNRGGFGSSGILKVTNLAGTGTRQVVADASGNLSATVLASPYLKYVALISQTGTSAPTATVLENTLGGAVVWTRAGIGSYVGTLSGVFTANKTAVFFTKTANGGAQHISSAFSPTVNTVVISNSSSGGAVDIAADNSSIEIRVYP